MLLTGLSGDGARVAPETDRIISIGGPKVVAAVIGTLTAHATNHLIHQHGSREAAIDSVAADLAAAVLAAGEAQP